MTSDDAIWSLIGAGKSSSCAYKVKAPDERLLCRNPYNSTGMCSRIFCPLANAQYATVMEYENKLYLYMKTAERSHIPLHQWKKLELPSNFVNALKFIDEKLQWWSTAIRLKCKQRTLRLTQMLLKRKKALRATENTEIIEVRKKEEHKLRSRERRVEAAAKIENTISKELLKRLHEGLYDSIIEQDDAVLEQVLQMEHEETKKTKLEKQKKKARSKRSVQEEEGTECIQADEFNKLRRTDNDIEDIVPSHGPEKKIKLHVPIDRQERVVIRREARAYQHSPEMQLN